MEFRAGDPVMHWTYGLGTVVRLEERDLLGQSTLYYAVQVGDLTVWVPRDAKLENRLRPPTPKSEFRKLRALLSGPGDPLPDDRHERRTLLIGLLKDGRAESLCRVVRALASYKQIHALNDHDQALLKRVEKSLLAEWGFAFSLTPAEAETEMHRLLAVGSRAH